MANINTVWSNKKDDVPKDHEMFTSQGGQSGTGVLRPVKGPNKKKAQEDPDYLNKIMNEQQQQGIKSDNKFKDAIYIYKNGFKIGNGPFNDINDPKNKKFLEEINNGTIPKELEPMMKQQFGGDANMMGVDIVNRKNEDYKPDPQQKAKFQAFKGDAHSMMDGNANKPAMDQSFDTAQPQRINCNDSQPNTRIQIILIGGKKETIKVNLSNTVLQIYAHVKAVSGYGGKFKLLAGFPPKPLSNPSATVADEKLQGARITQKKL